MASFSAPARALRSLPAVAACIAGADGRVQVAASRVRQAKFGANAPETCSTTYPSSQQFQIRTRESRDSRLQ